MMPLAVIVADPVKMNAERVKTLDAYLKRWNVPAIERVDTRVCDQRSHELRRQRVALHQAILVAVVHRRSVEHDARLLEIELLHQLAHAVVRPPGRKHHLHAAGSRALQRCRCSLRQQLRVIQ